MAAVDSNSIGRALGQAGALLAPLGNGRLEAELLLAKVLAMPRERFYAEPERPLSPERAADFRALVQQRCQGTPMAYLTGEREFWSLPFRVTRDTLIPRPDTECLVQAVLEHVPAGETLSILELGTGSGAIAVALAVERPRCDITAIDISPAALAVARANAARNGARHIRFLESDWFNDLPPDRYHLIVSNPPYVETDYSGFADGEIRHEPRLALDGGPAGLTALEYIIAAAPVWLHPGGRLLLEHADSQAAAVHDRLAGHLYREIRTFTDLSGQVRVTGGRKT